MGRRAGGGGERAKGEKGWDEVNEDGRKELSGSFLIGSPAATTLLSFLSLSSSLPPFSLSITSLKRNVPDLFSYFPELFLYFSSCLRLSRIPSASHSTCLFRPAPLGKLAKTTTVSTTRKLCSYSIQLMMVTLILNGVHTQIFLMHVSWFGSTSIRICNRGRAFLLPRILS